MWYGGNKELVFLLLNQEKKYFGTCQYEIKVNQKIIQTFIHSFFFYFRALNQKICEKNDIILQAVLFILKKKHEHYLFNRSNKRLLVAVVTILQTDPESGDQVVRTAAVLKKGNSFGVSTCHYNIFIFIDNFFNMKFQEFFCLHAQEEFGFSKIATKFC